MRAYTALLAGPLIATLFLCTACPQDLNNETTAAATAAAIAGDQSELLDPVIDVGEAPAPTAVGVTCPTDITVECDGAGNTAELDAWLDSIRVEQSCANLTIESNIRSLHADCAGLTERAVWTVTDDCGRQTCEAAFTIADTTPPELRGPADISACRDTDLTATVRAWLASAAAVDVCGDVSVENDFDATRLNGRLTPTLVTWTATDACGNEATHTATLSIDDSDDPPVVTLRPMLQLWPPNHKLRTLQLSDIVRSIVDDCLGELDIDEVGRVVAVTSDEPDNANGDGNGEGDIRIDGPSTFTLRAERQGGGNGRVYTIEFEVTVGDHTTTHIADINVPHDRSGRHAGKDSAARTVRADAR